MLHKLKQIKRQLEARLSESRIKEQKARFETRGFLEKTRRLEDPFLREHALNVIERGFTVVPASCSSEHVDAAAQSFLDWKQRNSSRFLPTFYKFDDKLDRIVCLHATLPEFQPLFTKNRSLLVQDYLFQDETVLYTSLFFEVGSAQDIHRDIPLFWTKPANMYFGTWVALEDTDSGNGPLLVIPGSHRLPLLDRDAIAREKYTDLTQIEDMDTALWDKYQGQIAQISREQGLAVEEVHVRKGDTIIWHPLLAHGGAAIADRGRTRLSFVVHTTPRNVPVFHTDVFFNINRRVSNKARTTYDEVDGRQLMRSTMTVGHSHKDFDFAQLS